MNFSLSHFSCIDHFIVSSNIFDNISFSFVLTDGANPSNHALIMMDITIASQSYLKPRTLSKEPNAITKPLWHKVNKYHIAHYKEKLAVILSNLSISTESLQCNDVKCTNLNHIPDINLLCSDIVNCYLQAGKYCFPHSTVYDIMRNVRLKRYSHVIWVKNLCSILGLIIDGIDTNI